MPAALLKNWMAARVRLQLVPRRTMRAEQLPSCSRSMILASNIAH